MKIKISNNLRTRCFAQQGVTISEVEECFLNRKLPFNCTDSVDAEGRTIWFIARTDRGRTLRISFSHKTKLSHVLQLPEKTVVMEQEGSFFEIKDVESLVHLDKEAIHV